MDIISWALRLPLSTLLVILMVGIGVCLIASLSQTAIKIIRFIARVAIAIVVVMVVGQVVVAPLMGIDIPPAASATSPFDTDFGTGLDLESLLPKEEKDWSKNWVPGGTKNSGTTKETSDTSDLDENLDKIIKNYLGR